MKKFDAETAKLERGITKWDIYQLQKDWIDDGGVALSEFEAYLILLESAEEE